MTNLILSAIIVIGTAFVLVWRSYGTSEAKTEKLREQIYKLEKERDDKYQKMQNAFDTGYTDMFYSLEHEWLSKCKDLHRLRKRLPKD